MAIADMIPTLDDKALAVLRANATRAEAGDHGPRREQAAILMPLIDAELAAREALKPPKKTPVRKKAVAKAAAPPEDDGDAAVAPAPAPRKKTAAKKPAASIADAVVPDGLDA